MYCTQCGTQLGDAARFCTSCGKPVSAPPSPGSPPGPAPGPAPAEPFIPEQAASPSTAPTKRLRRLAKGKKMAGVCAGFAEYFDMDVTLMRLIWVGLTIIPPHLGLIAYIVSWIVLPNE